MSAETRIAQAIHDLEVERAYLDTSAKDYSERYIALSAQIEEHERRRLSHRRAWRRHLKQLREAR